jgi:ElaB/YqjD/DUF883 family membrane-anchored ribosome-binding protein
MLHWLSRVGNAAAEISVAERLFMESRIEGVANPPNEVRTSTDKVMAEIKAMVQKAEEKAVERAKAADRLVRDHPYQTIGLAFGLGVLIGVLARRK